MREEQIKADGKIREEGTEKKKERGDMTKKESFFSVVTSKNYKRDA